MPLILILSVSFTSESSINEYGYSFIPKEWSFDAYYYVLRTGRQLMRSYGVSILVTIIGTTLALIFMSTYAYVVSRKSFKYRNFFSFLAFFTILFNGGMVPFYIICSRYYGLKDTLWALILPYTVNGFYLLILKSFFSSSIPDSIIESAKIDGASEFKTFISIVTPLSVPAIATIGLFVSLNYWNDWYLSLLFIDNVNLVPVQYMLVKIQQSIEFITSSARNMSSSTAELANTMPSETSRMALVILAIGPIILAYPFFQRFFLKGLTIGAVKG